MGTVCIWNTVYWYFIPDGSRKFVLRLAVFTYLLIIFTFFFFCRKWLTIEEIILPWMWYFYGGWWLIFVIGVLNSLEQIRASSGWKVFKSLKQVQDGFGAESELVAASDFGLKWKMKKCGKLSRIIGTSFYVLLRCTSFSFLEVFGMHCFCSN